MASSILIVSTGLGHDIRELIKDISDVPVINISTVPRADEAMVDWKFETILVLGSVRNAKKFIKEWASPERHIVFWHWSPGQIDDSLPNVWRIKDETHYNIIAKLLVYLQLYNAIPADVRQNYIVNNPSQAGG
jgi:hypothetical protein